MSDSATQNEMQHVDGPGGNGEGAPLDEVMQIFSAGPQPKQPDPQETPGVTPGTPPAQGATTPGASPPPVTPGPQNTQVQPGTTPAAPGAAPPPTPSPQQPELAQTLGQLAQAVEGLKTQPQTPTQPQVPDYEKLPEYLYNVPDEVMAALGSDNPAQSKAAIGAIATGISRQTHQTVLTTVKTMLEKAVLPAISARMQEMMAAAEVYRDFYSANPDLAGEEFRPTIEAVARSILKPGTPWNAQTKTLIAETARRVLNKAPAQQPQTPAPQAPAPVLTGGGVRGGVPQGGVGDEIMEMFKL